MALGVLVALLLLQQPDYRAEGLKALEARDWAAAVAAFGKLAEAEPEDAGAWFHLAYAHSAMGHHGEAVTGYRKTLELKPDAYEAQLNLGITLAEMGQPGEAAAVLRSATENKPGEATAHEYLGRALEAAGRLEEAEGALRRAAVLDPARRPVLLELARSWERAGQPGRAMAIYKEFPDHASARERLGALLLEAGRPEEAVAPLEAAVRDRPNAANRQALSIAYLRAGRGEAAAGMIEQALATDAGNHELRLVYAGLLRDGRDFAAAARQFELVAAALPGSKEAWTGLATMLVSLENYPGAVQALDHVEALGDVNPGVYFLRALARDKQRLYKPALADYRKFLELSENLPTQEFQARQRIRVIELELGRR